MFAAPPVHLKMDAFAQNPAGSDKAVAKGPAIAPLR
jgi:hypothetical protein